MKPRQTCGYLYADGHAVIIYEKEVTLGKTRTMIEYAVIHEKWTEACLSFKGRLAFSRYGSAAMLDLCKRARTIRASEISLQNGSENTRKLGVEVGNLTFDFADGSCLFFNDTSIFSGQYRYQPEITDTFNPEATTWGSAKVSEVKRCKVTVAKEVAA